MTELVREIMKNQVITVDLSLTVMDAAKIMEDAGVGCVVVMEENTPVGMLTERDFVRKIAAHEKPVYRGKGSNVLTFDCDKSR